MSYEMLGNINQATEEYEQGFNYASKYFDENSILTKKLKFKLFKLSK